MKLIEMLSSLTESDNPYFVIEDIVHKMLAYTTFLWQWYVAHSIS